MPHSFYITLPSNVNGIDDNKLWDYKTILPQPLRLTGDYFVALTELTYTKSWYNISEKHSITIENLDGVFWELPGIVGGSYTSVQQLIEKINQIISKNTQNLPHTTFPKLEYDDVNHTTRMYLGKNSRDQPLILRLGKELEDVLGFDASSFQWKPSLRNEGIVLTLIGDNGTGYIESKWSDFRAGIHSIMVYSDVVAHSIVGNTHSNFLRSITVSKEDFGEDVSVIFQKPYYFPVATRDVDSIRINIKDDNDRFINFKFGRVCATLHFKKTWKTII